MVSVSVALEVLVASQCAKVASEVLVASRVCIQVAARVLVALRLRIQIIQ